jgi:hypothetical protein
LRREKGKMHSKVRHQGINNGGLLLIIFQDEKWDTQEASKEEV